MAPTPISVDSLTLTFFRDLHAEVHAFLASATQIDQALLSQWRQRTRTFSNSSASTTPIFTLLHPYLDVSATMGNLRQLENVLARVLHTRMDIPSPQQRLVTLLQEDRAEGHRRETVNLEAELDFVVAHSVTIGNTTEGATRAKLKSLSTPDLLLVAQLRRLVVRQQQEGVVWTTHQWKTHCRPLHPAFALLFRVQSFQEMKEKAQFSPWYATPDASSVTNTVLCGLPLPPTTLLEFAQTTCLYPSPDIAVLHFLNGHLLDGFWEHIRAHPDMLPTQATPAGERDKLLQRWATLLKWPILTDDFFKGRTSAFRTAPFPWKDLLGLTFDQWKSIMTNRIVLASTHTLTHTIRHLKSKGEKRLTMVRIIEAIPPSRTRYAGARRDVDELDDDEGASDRDEDDEDRPLDVDDLLDRLESAPRRDDDDPDRVAEDDELPSLQEEDGDDRDGDDDQHQQPMASGVVASPPIVASAAATETSDQAVALRVRWPDGRIQTVRVRPTTRMQALLSKVLSSRKLPALQNPNRAWVLSLAKSPLRTNKTVADLRLRSGTLLELDILVKPTLYSGSAEATLQRLDWTRRVSLPWRILLLQTRPWIQDYSHSLIHTEEREFCATPATSITTQTDRFCHPSARFFKLVASTPIADQSQRGDVYVCKGHRFKILHVLTNGNSMLQSSAVFKKELDWCATQLAHYVAGPKQRVVSILAVGNQPFASLNEEASARLLDQLKTRITNALNTIFTTSSSSITQSTDVALITPIILEGLRTDATILDVIRQVALLLVWIDTAQSPLAKACPTFRARLVNFGYDFDTFLSIFTCDNRRKWWSFVFPEFWAIPRQLRTSLLEYMASFVETTAIRTWLGFYCSTENNVMAEASLLSEQILLSSVRVPTLEPDLVKILDQIQYYTPSTSFPVRFPPSDDDDDNDLDAAPVGEENVAQLATNWVDEDVERRTRASVPSDFAKHFNCLYAQYGGAVDDSWAGFEPHPFPQPLQPQLSVVNAPEVASTTMTTPSSMLDVSPPPSATWNVRPDFYDTMMSRMQELLVV